MESKEVVYVEWLDAASSGDWRGYEDVDDLVGAVECRTIGFLVKENNDELIISPTLADTQGQYASYFAIPQGCIKNRWTININGMK